MVLHPADRKMKKAEDFDSTAAIYKTAAQLVFNDFSAGVYDSSCKKAVPAGFSENAVLPAVKPASSIAEFVNSKMDAFMREAEAEAGSGPITMAFDQLGQAMEWDKEQYEKLLVMKEEELAKSAETEELKPGDTLLKRAESLKTVVLMFPSAMGIMEKGKVALMTPYRGKFPDGRLPLATMKDDEIHRPHPSERDWVTPMQFMMLFEIKKRMLEIAEQKMGPGSLDVRVVPHPVVDDYEWNTHLGTQNHPGPPTKSLLEAVSWKACAEVPWSALYGNSNWENFIFVGTHLKFDGSRPWSHQGEQIERGSQGELIEEVCQVIKPGVPRLCRWKPCSLCAARMSHKMSDIVNSPRDDFKHARKRVKSLEKPLRRTETCVEEVEWMEHSLDSFCMAPDMYQTDGFFLRMKKIVG